MLLHSLSRHHSAYFDLTTSWLNESNKIILFFNLYLIFFHFISSSFTNLHFVVVVVCFEIQITFIHCTNNFAIDITRYGFLNIILILLVWLNWLNAATVKLSEPQLSIHIMIKEINKNYCKFLSVYSLLICLNRLLLHLVFGIQEKGWFKFGPCQVLCPTMLPLLVEHYVYL